MGTVPSKVVTTGVAEVNTRPDKGVPLMVMRAKVEVLGSP